MNPVETKDQNCICCGSDESTVQCKGIDFEYATCSNTFEYHKCSNCGHVYLKNVPLPKELNTIYPANYQNYSGDRSKSIAFRVKSKLDVKSMGKLRRHIKDVKAVMDVGCADGGLLDVARKVFPDAKTFVGVEISEVAAKAAKDKGYEVIVGSADDIDFGESKYDLIILQQVIEHVFNPDKVTENLERSLKPGGLLVIETPTNECLDMRIWKKRYWGGYHIPRHFNIFNAKTYQRITGKYRLELVDENYKLQPVHWIWSWHHVLQEKGWPKFIVNSLHLRNPIFLGIFTFVELFQKPFTRRTSNMRLVFRKTS